MSQNYHDFFESGNYYHIYNRSINKEPIFKNEGNYEFFLRQWKKYLFNHLDTFSYCLMPTHYHFFVQEKDQTDNLILEDLFKRFLSSYSLAFNKENQRQGSLFQKRFKRTRVDSDEYFTKIIHYIHNNPIHHSYVLNYADWKFSSYKSIVSQKETLICRDEVLDWFGDRTRFVEFHQQNVVFDKIEDA